MKIIPGLAVLTLAGVPAAAVAQDRATSGPDIVVTGRGLDASPADRVVDVVTLDRDRIATNASGRLESVLADVAGLQQFRRSDSRSANASSQGVSLRGIGGNASSRALLILDGVPQADPFGGWVTFPAYATNRLGQVRVTRGGGSGYYGPGALVGTIELESATPGQLDTLYAHAAYGSRESVEGQGSVALVRDGGFATVSGAYARGDGFIPTVAESRGSVDRPARYEQASGAVRGVVRVGPDTELQANLAAFTDSRERGTAFTDNQSEGADASIRLVGRGNWGWSALAYVQTRAFASSFVSINAARTTATQTLDQYNTPATGLGARFEVAPPVGEHVNLRLGGDVRAVTGRTKELFTYVAALPTRRREAGGASNTYGVFADGSAAFGPVTLAIGGRYDHWEITDGFLSERALAGGAALTDTKFADRSGDEATGRMGLAWQVAAPIALRAAAYRGWRLPTLNELYRPFRVGADATAANAALAPERLSGYEFGATLTPAAGVRLAATWFDNRLDNAIANVTAGRGPGTFPGVGFVAAGGLYRVRQNLDGVRVRGIEVDAEASHGQGFARASWSHVNSRVEASGAAAPLDGLVPAQTPSDQVSGTIGWRKGTAVISTTLRYVASQFDDDQNTRVLRPATTVDAYAALPITRRLAIEARAENIGDARVETGISGANIVERATPRTVWIGLRYGG
ncbi:TonB-dependent receptor [Sphingomonas donggukensis]|uniref:TonB-dependent receptor n=1 Tax=Sphingomonas donggukensis TaxID=2949093 RepID=A0ABY4TXF2_9SPHN|nr:TonB-dependent receptor [Sphingomonas donggukensis]URW76336.1 TonB-dependent receptor [Sphingomonas donggukensis]